MFDDRGYRLGAGDDGEDAYRLLHDALAKADRSASAAGSFAIASTWWQSGRCPMRWRCTRCGSPPSWSTPRRSSLRLRARSRPQREIDMAGTLVESLHDDFGSAQFQDGYRDRVLALVHAKARGEEPELLEPEQSEPDTDVMAALEASLNAGRR